MPTALLETKLYIPRSRRGLVPRPRLSERLDRGAASTLMLVSAPAGFGKTTLLTEWLAAGPAAPADERRAAWLSLDRGDNDPASFWTYVIAALRTAAPGVGESALALLRAPQPPPIETVLTALLNDLGAVAGESCWCSTTTTSSTRARCTTGWRSCSSICLRAPRGDRQPGRSRVAAGPVAGARRAGRDARGRAAVHAR